MKTITRIIFSKNNGGNIIYLLFIQMYIICMHDENNFQCF